jgi:AcrR family transcriptional regulator
MPSRRAEWLDAVVRYLLKHGAASASLRPIAAELGTSARVLLFHFKSKEGLLQAVMRELEERLQERLRSLAQRPRAKQVAPLKLFWQWSIREENLPWLCLLYEMQIIAMQNPEHYGSYLKQASKRWRREVLRLMSQAMQSPALATLCIAVFDGLFLEYVATKDLRRLTRALDDFIVAMRQQASLARREG